MSYDDMCVYWGPTPVGTGYGSGTVENGVIITANSKANAAILACGVSVTDNRLTHDVKQALGSSSSGGAFYRLAQMMHSMSGSNGYSYPGWNAAPTAIMDTLAATLGAENVWYCDYTDDELASATEDLTTILNGGTIGGGSSNNTGELSSSVILYNNGSTSHNYGDTISCELSETVLRECTRYLNQYKSDYSDCFWVIRYGYNNNSDAYFTLFSHSDVELVTDNGRIISIKNISDNTLRYKSYFRGRPTFNSSNSSITLTNDGGTSTGSVSKDSTFSLSENWYISIVNNGSGSGSGSGSGGSGSGGDEGGGSGGGGTDVPDDDLDWPEPSDPNYEFEFDTTDIVNVLSKIYADMKNLDRSTNDLVNLQPVISAINGLEFPETDLSNVEDYLDRILTALGEVSGIDFNGINGMLAYVHNDLTDIYAALEDLSVPSAPDLSGIRSDLADILDELQGLDVGTDMTTTNNLITTTNTKLQSIINDMANLDRSTSDLVDLSGVISAINALDIPGDVDLSGVISAIEAIDLPETDLTDLVSSVDDVADACTDIYTDIHAYFAEMLGYWDGLDDEFVTFFTGWGGFVSNINNKWSALMNKLDLIYKRLGKKPWTGDYSDDPGIDMPDPGDDLVHIGDDDFELPALPWEVLAPILKIPALEAAIMELMSKFPFVMLNELVTIGTYIQRTPTAPVFDLPAPNPSDWSHPLTVRIDLSQFDVAAAVLRAMIMIWACVRISNRTIKMWMGDKAVV